MTAPAREKMAMRALEVEGAEEDVAGIAAASVKVHDKLRASLVPLLGAASVDALLVRSAQMTSRQMPFLKGVFDGGAARLGERLREQTPKAASSAAVALFGTFLALIATFIGERLTAQALQKAWPALVEPTSRGKP
jgi:hypothetical protein